MMSRTLIYLLSYTFFALILMLTGTTVLYADTRSRVNRWFFLMLSACTIWLGFVFASDYRLIKTSIVLDNIAVLLGNAIAITTFFFAKEIIYSSRYKTKVYVAVFTGLALNLFVTAAGYSFIGLNPNTHHGLGVIVGPGDYVHLIFVFTLIFGSFVQVYLKARHSNTKNEYDQFHILVYGGLAAAVVNLSNEIYYTVLGGSYGKYDVLYDLITGSSLVIFALIAAYAIIRHGLFDVKRAVMRAIGYFVFLTAIAILYSSVIVLSIAYISGTTAKLNQLVISITTVIFVTFTLPIVKKFFDKTTNRIFYRESYDLKQVLDQLTDILVTNIEQRKIIDGCLKQIHDALKPSHAYLASTEDRKVVSSGGIGNDELVNAIATTINEGNYLKSIAGKRDSEQIVDINTQKENKVRDILNLTGSEICLRLNTNEGLAGFLLLGSKQNGDRYTVQDRRLLKIISKNLALALQNTHNYEKIRGFAETLQDRVESATEKLKKSNRELQKLSKTKDEFISMASHQLQPQLSASRGFIDMMGRSESEDKELINLTKTSIARMTQQVSDMLNVTRIQTGGITLETESVDLVSLVESEIKNLKFAVDKHKVHIEFHHPGHATIEVDYQKFREAIFNLLDNAIQYSHRGGTVFISIKKEGKTTKLQIADRGIGIPLEEQDKLFTNYFRASNAIEKRPSGTGIGLFVTKKILEAHGCELLIISEPGRGTQATVYIRESNTLVTG